MILFAFTTLLGNLYYVDSALAFINRAVPGKVFMSCYRLVAALLIFIGAGSSMGLLWDTSDVVMGCMAIINLPTIVILGGRAMACLKDYEQQKKAGKNPVFKASSIGIKEQLDYWN